MLFCHRYILLSCLRAVNSAVTAAAKQHLLHSKDRQKKHLHEPRPILYFSELKLDYMTVSCSAPFPYPNRGRRGVVPNSGLQDTIQCTSSPLSKVTSKVHLLHSPSTSLPWVHLDAVNMLDLFIQTRLAKTIPQPHNMELDHILSFHKGYDAVPSIQGQQKHGGMTQTSVSIDDKHRNAVLMQRCLWTCTMLGQCFTLLNKRFTFS